jgi:5-methylcytosine-specific restriction endonuclease McrA
VVFERDHFWGTASSWALAAQRVYGIDGHHLIGVVCRRCGEIAARPEVNHIEPVNGGPRHFTCRNHQDNLEVLCHECHVVVTSEQRAAGLFQKAR